jgi:DNA-binding MarR family transcriptional regulator
MEVAPMPTVAARNGRSRRGDGSGARRREKRDAGGNAPFVPDLTTSRREFIVDGRDENFRNIIYAMVLGLQRLAACREAFGSYLGLTGSQFAVLIGAAYRQERNGVTIKELSDHVLLASTHVTTEVKRLMRKNLLAKRPNRDDGRSVLVYLTPGGEEAVRAVTPVVRAVNDALFAGIAARELAIAGRVLKTIGRNGEEALARARALRRERLPGNRASGRAGTAARAPRRKAPRRAARQETP